MLSYLLALTTILMVPNVEVYWENDYLEISLYEDVNPYFEMPRAYVNINGIIYEANYYRDDRNYTSKSVVNSNHPNKYFVDYEAYFDDLGIKSSIRRITFDVKDNEAPTIKEVPSFRFPLNQKLDNLTKDIVVSDNYDTAANISISVNTSQVVITRVGIYEIIYTVKDSSHNVNTYKSTYEVFDHLPPEIENHKPLILNVNTKFEVSNFFKFKDNYDTNLDVFVSLDKLNINKLGFYEIVVSVSDLSLNQTTESFLIEVVDNIAPRLDLTANPKPIVVYQVINEELLRNYIINVSDNNDLLTVGDVKITHDIDSSFLGKYTIYYELSDNSGNLVTKTLKVEVKDNVIPSVDVSNELVIDVGSVYFDYRNHFIISDNYDELNALTITISEKINLNKLGSYPVTIKVVDQSKNTYNNVFIILVVDREKPEIIINDNLEFGLNSNPDYLSYLIITDNYDSKVVASVDDSNVNYKEEGVYEVVFKAVDQSNNTTFLTKEVKIIDIMPPVIILSSDNIYVDMWISSFDIYDLIIDYYDDSTPKEQILVTVDFEMDITKEMETFEGNIVATDLANNETSIKFYVHYLEDKENKKYFNVSNITINQGDAYQVFSGVDTNIDKNNIYISDAHVDVNKSGVYEIIYYFTNNDNNVETHVQELTVLASNKFDILEHKSFLVVLAVIIGVVIYYFYTSKKKGENSNYL